LADHTPATLPHPGIPSLGIWPTGGSTGELVTLNRSLNNTLYDMEDDSQGCGTDKWESNTFKTANETCIH